MKIVFATGNKGKLREASEILGPAFELQTPAQLGITDELPETAMTIEENSLQKAMALRELCGLDCFADDTGLEVDALGGAPGAHAARFATDVALRDGLPLPADDHDFDANIDALLRELEKHPGAPRTARFRSVVTLLLGDEVHIFEGTMEGRIAFERSGCRGFGYDPVFVADDYPDRSVAELPDELKNAISHRGKALRKMAAWLKQNGYE